MDDNDSPADTLTIGPNQHTPIHYSNTAELAEKGQLVYVRQSSNVFQPFGIAEVQACVEDNNQNPITREPNLSGAPMFAMISYQEIQKKEKEERDKKRRAAARAAEQNLIYDLVRKNPNVFSKRWNLTEDDWVQRILFIQSQLGHGPLAEDDIQVAAKFAMEASTRTLVDQINCPLSMSANLRQVIKILRGCFKHAHVLLKKKERAEAKRAEANRIAKDKRDREEKRAAAQAATKHKKKVEKSKLKLDVLVKRFLMQAKVEECNKLLGSVATANAIETAVLQWQQTQ